MVEGDSRMDLEDDGDDLMDPEREENSDNDEYMQTVDRIWHPVRSGTIPYHWPPGSTSSRSTGTAAGQQFDHESVSRHRGKPDGSSGSSSERSGSEDSDGGDAGNADEMLSSELSRAEEVALSRYVSDLSLRPSAQNTLPPSPRGRRRSRGRRKKSRSRGGRAESLDPGRFIIDSEGNISTSGSPVRSRSLEGPPGRFFRRLTVPSRRIPGWSSDAGADVSFPRAGQGRRLDDDYDHGRRPDDDDSTSNDRNHIRRRTYDRSRFGPDHSPPRNTQNSPRSSASDSGRLGSRDQPSSSFSFGQNQPSRSRAPNFLTFAPARAIPSRNQNAPDFDMMGEVPVFAPNRGDIIVLKPPTRSRRHNHNSFNPTLVRTFNDRFGFGDGDLIVRIGTYARFRNEEEASYVPYRIVELYRRYDSQWTFLGAAHSQEDLGRRRRRSGFDMRPFRGRSGEAVQVSPNWGDFIIRQGMIRHDGQGQRSTEDMLFGIGVSQDEHLPVIDWWTPNLPEEVNGIYPHNAILLRPYLHHPQFFWARQMWLETPDVIRRDCTNGMGQQGTIKKIWPESLVHDRPLPGDYEPLEVVGPYRVGVKVVNPPGAEVAQEMDAWPLTSTFFLNVKNRSLYDYLTSEDQAALNSEPWGLIEMYTYSAGVQPGWIYWGSSRHICDTPVP